MWQVYRFRDYFEREVLAVFFDCRAAEDFALANMSQYPNGVYVGPYRKA